MWVNEIFKLLFICTKPVVKNQSHWFYIKFDRIYIIWHPLFSTLCVLIVCHVYLIIPLDWEWRRHIVYVYYKICVPHIIIIIIIIHSGELRRTWRWRQFTTGTCWVRHAIYIYMYNRRRAARGYIVMRMCVLKFEPFRAGRRGFRTHFWRRYSVRIKRIASLGLLCYVHIFTRMYIPTIYIYFFFIAMCGRV